MPRAERRGSRTFALHWTLAAGLSAAAMANAQVSPPGAASAPREALVSVWVDLDLPELASLPRHRRAERDALAVKIRAQQDEVMAQLLQLGAIEQARIQQVRNALAVRLPGAQLDAARRVAGVRAVRGVRNIERGPLVQGK